VRQLPLVRGLGWTLPQRGPLDVEGLADAAEAVIDFAVDLVGTKMNEAHRDLEQERL